MRSTTSADNLPVFYWELIFRQSEYKPRVFGHFFQYLGDFGGKMGSKNGNFIAHTDSIVSMREEKVAYP